MIDLFGCREATPMRPGAHSGDYVFIPEINLLGLSLPAPFSRIPLALQPIGDQFFVNCYIPGTYILTEILDFYKLHTLFYTNSKHRIMRA